MIGLAKVLDKHGDTDINAEGFWNEVLLLAPGQPNIGKPLPYPKLPEGYKLLGTTDSLDAGRVKINHKKK